MFDPIYLPKLNNLTPTLESTLLKAMEEAGELARAVLNFLPYEDVSPGERAGNTVIEGLLGDVTEELLDVAQTCVTMIFVMEEFYGIRADDLIGFHLEKLRCKGYHYDTLASYAITTTGNFKTLNLPRLSIEGVTLLKTVCKIQEELGELTQFLGKRAGASGEKRDLSKDQILKGSSLELLDIAQCCFTMMYILAEKHAVDVKALTERHVSKLRRKGYCA
jgi:NTP pyrophosphatase (non-canonical NTP hydrolase)